MREVDLSIVTFEPDLPLLQRLCASLAEPLRRPLRRNLFVHDNSPDPEVARRVAALPELQPGRGFERVSVAGTGANLGFGRGHNANAALGSAAFLFVLNQDCVLEPGALEAAIDTAEADAAEVASWELRQIPYEHPKEYDPVTLDTSWSSGAALLLRRGAFEAVGGFEPRIFMYGEDVDLSWRLRAAGWRVTYRPQLAAVHRTYAKPFEVKPLQLEGSVRANLCLRARYGGPGAVFEGLVLLAAALARPQGFPGRRGLLLRAARSFLADWPYFARTRVRPREDFAPEFDGWDYGRRRDGAFHEFASARERARREPLVSILIRTVDRPAQLREALASCAGQTHRNLEVVVVEDGPERSRGVVEAFSGRLAVRYHATGAKVGRARAGNLALAQARGEWLNFLDDDDVLFADHVEVLLAEALRLNAAGAYGLAWETQLRWLDEARTRYVEESHLTRFRHRFDRFALWHQNFIPIQSALFHRSLYERFGGFLEDMDQLEDWNLWTRYTLVHELVLVEKTTSKYRVPADPVARSQRLAALQGAHYDALERQRQLQVACSPRQIVEMAHAFVEAHGRMPPPAPLAPVPAADAFGAGYQPKAIRRARFANQKVLLDGYDYEGCEFVNVTFEYNGTTPIRLSNNRIEGAFRLSSQNPAVLATLAWVYGMGLTRAEIPFANSPGQVQRAEERTQG